MSYEDLIARLRKGNTHFYNDCADAIATLQAELAAARESHAEAEKECDRLHASEFEWRSKFIDAHAGAEAAEARVKELDKEVSTARASELEVLKWGAQLRLAAEKAVEAMVRYEASDPEFWDALDGLKAAAQASGTTSEPQG